MTWSADLAAALPEWLPRQRWFAGKGEPVTAVELRAEEPLTTGDPALVHLVIRVHGERGSADYQLPVGIREQLPERLEYAAIATLDGRHVYDAMHDPELGAVLLRAIVEGASYGHLRFVAEPGAPLAGVDEPGRPAPGEQSNSSLIYGDQLILKLFRRVAPGLNPDVELHRALASVGSPHIAPPYGAIEGLLDGDPATYGMLQAYVANAADGWQMAIASVRDLFAEGDLHADEVGGDFAAEAHRLGQATADVHRALAEALGSALAGPEQIRSSAAAMDARLRTVVEVVPALEAHAAALQEAFAELADLPGPVAVQRIHGDFHLGQVIRGLSGWVLLDFEGEPARPLAERTAPMSPLRDVAGMLRSFDYAARHLLADHPGDTQLAYRAGEWAERNREAFCDGYAEAAGADPRKEATLLRAFELDKAVYEVLYEARHRPSWLAIPLGSIARLLA